MLDAARRARELVEEYEGRDRRVAELTVAAQAAARELNTAASALSALRAKAGTALARRIAGEFGDLALASARFEVATETLERIGPAGAERVEFLFAANAGEPVRPLGRVASGGELSRVLLALIVGLAGARDARSALVFDEIDAGIGGRHGHRGRRAAWRAGAARPSGMRDAPRSAGDVGAAPLRAR